MNTRRAVIFHREALMELCDASEWYDSQSWGMVEKLLDDVADCIGKIRANPQSFRLISNRIRRATLKKFRAYSVIFESRSNQTIFVVSIFHARRDPAVWEERIRS